MFLRYFVNNAGKISHGKLTVGLQPDRKIIQDGVNFPRYLPVLDFVRNTDDIVRYFPSRIFFKRRRDWQRSLYFQKDYIHTIVYPRTSCTLNIMAKTPAARRCCMTTPPFATRITFSIEASKTNAEYSTAGREYE